MNRRLVSVILTLALVSAFSMTFKVQEVEGIVIRPDGTVEPSTAPIQRVGYVYTLTDNIYEGIVIQRSNIIVDGAGYTIQGTGSGHGFKLYGINDVAIQNMTIKEFSYGIWLESSFNVTFSGNNINNTKYSIGVFGSEITHYMHTIGDSNLVNGKPIYYLSNHKNIMINPITYPEVGFLALINCTNVSVEGFTLQNTGQGLLLAYTNNTRIMNNNVTNNDYGLWLEGSSNITISDNNITANNEYGVKSIHSTHNIICLNKITNNNIGVCLELSTGNTISENNITKNSNYSVLLSNSSDNVISGNIIESIRFDTNSNNNIISGASVLNSVDFLSSNRNTISGHEIELIKLSRASYNTIFENNIQHLRLEQSNNNSIFSNRIWESGLSLTSSRWNTIFRNQITNLQGYGIKVESCYHNVFSDNNITNSRGAGIYLVRSSDNTISSNNITNIHGTLYIGNDGCGIRFYAASYNIVSGNNITRNDYGIWQQQKWMNKIIGNNITRNRVGIYLEDWAPGNLISANYLANNYLAIYIYQSEFNNITFNTIINNENGIQFGKQAAKNIILSNIIMNNSCNGIQFVPQAGGNTISCNTIINNGNNGIVLKGFGNNSISGNNITNCYNNGIQIISSKRNIISGNNIMNSYTGIWLELSSENTLIANIIVNNLDGVGIHLSSDNTFYHNSFINNTRQAYIQTPESVNFWNNSYPSGGNYWNSYNGIDSNKDGLGDTPYFIDTNITDNYPLMGMFLDFNATSEHYIQTICNSTISGFQFNGTAIKFTISGQSGTTGFCRICIPKALMNETYRILVNSTEISYTHLIDISNATHNYLYFTYPHSTQEITIIPEFPSLSMQLIFIATVVLGVLFILATLLGAALCKRKHHKPH